MRRIFHILIVLFLLASNASFAFAVEEGNVGLSINPLLKKINAAPGDSWAGSVEIFNSNPRDLEFVLSVQDFRGGEEGRVEFIDRREIEKSIDKGKEFLLSHWIEIDREPIMIPARRSAIVPFTIRIPDSAGPGGKYAAILATIRSPEVILPGTNLVVSPSVGSLILLNVRGDVTESAFIREFSTTKNLYTRPEVPLTVRIQNDGNTHVQPRGDIKIYNRQGKVVDTMLVNYGTEFGNILPQSGRSWDFVWESENNFFEIGRYEAALTLVYGEEAGQTISKKLHFWVLPINLFIGVLGGAMALLIIVFLTEYLIGVRRRRKEVTKDS